MLKNFSSIIKTTGDSPVVFLSGTHPKRHRPVAAVFIGRVMENGLPEPSVDGAAQSTVEPEDSHPHKYVLSLLRGGSTCIFKQKKRIPHGMRY